MPAISVVMPVFNRAQTVRRAIDSVLWQDFPDFELVIVDDGSRDGTPEVIQALGDSRIRLFVQPENRGGNAARNRGIWEANSALICFLDSDDEFLPHKLGVVAGYFSDNPGVDAILDSFELQYPPKRGGSKAKRINPALLSSEAVREAVFSRRLYKATPALSARRVALIESGLFDETLRRRQDMDLVLRLAASSEMRSISNVLWTKYWTEGAISSKQETFMAALTDMCERHPEYLSKHSYRKGLARDVARHVLRLAIKGRLATIRRDFRQFAMHHSIKEALSLFVQGLWEIVVRAGSRR